MQYSKLLEALLTVAPGGQPNHSCLKATIRYNLSS